MAFCRFCKLGGRYLEDGLIESARAAHAQCPGPTHCDCQHATDQSYINQERVPKKVTGDDS